MTRGVRGVPCRVGAGSQGILVGAPGPWGPRVALVESRSALQPAWATTLGELDEPTSTPPALAMSRRSLEAAFIERGEAKRVLLPDGSSKVFAADRRHVALGVMDDEIFATTAGESLWLHLPKQPALLLVQNIERLSALEVVAVGASVVVLFAAAESAVLGVCHRGGDEVRMVRHPLRAPVTHMAAVAMAGRVGLALSYGDDGVDHAVLDAEGQMVERPHPRLRGSGLRLSSPQVAWVESGFSVGAMAQGELRMEGLPGEPSMVIQACPSPCHVLFRRSRLLVVGAEEQGDETCVRLVAQNTAGGEREEHAHWLAPRGDSLRRNRSRARSVVRELLAHGRALGRDGAGLETSSSGLGVSFAAAGRDGPRASWRFEALEHTVRLRVLRSEGEDALPPQSSLLRLAAWVRGTVGLSPVAAPPELEQLRASVAQCVAGTPVGLLRHAAGAFEFTLELSTVPSVEALLEAGSLLRAASAPPS